LKARTYFSKLLCKTILILEYSYLDFLKLTCPWSLFLSQVGLIEYSPYSGFVKPLLQVLTGVVNRGHVGRLDMIWLSSLDLGTLPKLSSVVLLDFHHLS
jgi:hypothetical protein